MHPLLADRASAMLHQPERRLAKAREDTVPDIALETERLTGAGDSLGANGGLWIQCSAFFVRRAVGTGSRREANRLGEISVGADHGVGQYTRGWIVLERREDELQRLPYGVATTEVGNGRAQQRLQGRARCRAERRCACAD